MTDPNSPLSGRAVGGGAAPGLRRPPQWWKAPPPGTPSRHPHSEQRRPARAHAVGPVLGPHARTDRTRDTQDAEPWLPAPEDGRPGEGQRLTPGAPHNGGRPPPQPMAGPQGRDCHAAPPPAARRRRQGTRGPPPLPPPSHSGPRAGGGAAPPAPPPHPPPAGEPQARPSAPPEPRGRPPPPRRDGNAEGGAAAGPASASPHWRAGATRTTEQYGGRAPHDPPVTTAHLGRAEGGFRSTRAPRGAVHGPPLTPPQPGAALRPRPHAHAGRERADDTKGARIEYRRPPPRRGAGRPRHHPPPPPPHRPASRGGPGPHPPRQGGWSPPRPREEPERDPPPRPSRRLRRGPRRISEPAPTRQDAAQIAPREAW